MISVCRKRVNSTSRSLTEAGALVFSAGSQGLRLRARVETLAPGVRWCVRGPRFAPVFWPLTWASISRAHLCGYPAHRPEPDSRFLLT